MKDEREVMPDTSIEIATSAQNQKDEVVLTPEPTHNGVNRRGFLGKTMALLAAAAAGIWSSPRAAKAQQVSQPLLPICDIDCPPPPEPIDYTFETTDLINNLVANFNAHNAQAVVNAFSSSVVNAPQMLSSMNNAFTAFPDLQLTLTSMSVGIYGRSVTINYSMTGTHTVAVYDSMVVSSGAALAAAAPGPTDTVVAGSQAIAASYSSDTATGTNTFTVLNGSLITRLTGDSTIPTVFQAHGASIVVS